MNAVTTDEAGEDDIFEAPAHSFLKTEAISGRASSRKVVEILASMKTDGWKGPPIQVFEHGGERYILNGHHRTYAARLARIPVRYRVANLPAFGYNSPMEVVTAHAESGHNRISLR
jgi:hypothetical protein